MGDSTTLGLRERFLGQVRREPRKAATLAVLLAVMLLAWVRGGAAGKAGPAQASASPSPANPAATPGNAGPQMNRTLRALEGWLNGPIAPTERNLFLMKLDYFPAEASATATQAAAEKDGNSDDAAKSQAAAADLEKARRILEANIKAQASRLDLQSTVMTNGSPRALVNGMMVGEGDTIEGFRVVRIEARGIVVEREGVKLEVSFSFR